jgi:hypothetical protein
VKRIEKLLVVLALGFIVERTSMPVAARLLSWWAALGHHTDATVTSAAHVTQYILMILAALTAVVFAVWLFLEARREKLTPWVWCLFGFAFKLDALILFYLYVVCLDARLTGRSSTEPSRGGAAGAAPVRTRA